MTHAANAEVRSLGSRGRLSYANCEVEDGRLVLIEPQLFLREILQQAFSRCMPHVQIDSVGGSEDVAPGPARLVVIGINPGPGLDVGALRAIVEKARAQCVEAPIAAILHGEDASLVKTLRALGLVGVVQQSASLAIAVAAVRLMMVGGVFLPPEQTCEQSPPLATQWGRQPCDNAAGPEIGELHGDSPSEKPLTARELDVLKILREGRQNKTIAFTLGISESTVKVHLRNIMKKLNVSNRMQVVLGVGGMRGA
jgi:DNA-binding NarL/FixJ family response regulator